MRICNPPQARIKISFGDMKKPTAADYKSAKKRSNLFDGGLQIRQNT